MLRVLIGALVLWVIVLAPPPGGVPAAVRQDDRETVIGRCVLTPSGVGHGTYTRSALPGEGALREPGREILRSHGRVPKRNRHATHGGRFGTGAGRGFSPLPPGAVQGSELTSGHLCRVSQAFQASLLSWTRLAGSAPERARRP